MKHDVNIDGNKIRLRCIKEEDLGLKVKWINDPDVHKYLHYDLPLDIENTKKWYHRVKDDPSRYDLVVETIEGKPIGLGGLIGINLRHKTAEFYIAIGEKEYWGKGMGFETASLITNWAFNYLGLYKLWAAVRAENKAMLAMMGKIGYKTEGILKEERDVDGKRVDIARIAVLRSNVEL